jgi:C4-dicarboxylate-specific signal transduction histidine kinase
MLAVNGFTQRLVNMIAAQDVGQVVDQTLALLVDLLHPQWAGVLLWDGALNRYILGAVWMGSCPASEAPTLRREILRKGEMARQSDVRCARYVDTGLFYQPLHTASAQHVGAFCIGIDHMSPTEHYGLLVRTCSSALHSALRLQQAESEHAELHAERERLERLLQAVEQQQQVIDRLLAAERQFSASLEVKVEERTAALQAAQTRLIQSEKLAVIGQLASSLAHELNNPLQAIQSGLGLLVSEVKRGNTPQVLTDLDIIQSELERIQALFRQMLDFYRPVSYECQPLDLNAICQAVQVLMHKRLQDAHVSLHLGLSSPLPLICGDSNQIKQVLLNLLLNAVEAMPVQGGNIVLGTASANGQVAIRVVDDGPGIPEELREKLFEPLFTTKTRGLGLGLAISQEIIQRHGGEIRAESDPEAGTVFTVSLPVRKKCHDE